LQPRVVLTDVEALIVTPLKGLTFQLWVRQDTALSGPPMDDIVEGTIKKMEIP
jgi:hypothetical protein